MCTSEACHFCLDRPIHQSEAALVWMISQSVSFGGLNSAGPNESINFPTDFGDNGVGQHDDCRDVAYHSCAHITTLAIHALPSSVRWRLR